jgi:hypothetical protein
MFFTVVIAAESAGDEFFLAFRNIATLYSVFTMEIFVVD